LETSQPTQPEGVELSIHARNYAGKTMETDAVIDALAPEAQAGLRQYSLERMTGYGVNYSDAIELRSRIVAGEAWQKAAQALAEEALAAAQRKEPPASRATRLEAYHRASALMRMSQALMLEDNELRRGIVQESVDYYAKAVELGLLREHVHIDTPEGKLSGWFVASTINETVGTAIVIGGVEGWAMDFDVMGDAMAARGIATLLLDAPGQGESRILNNHYLTSGWLECFRSAIDWCETRLPDKPIGLVGNSMGGAIAIAMANQDARVAACINNGGIIKPSLGRMAGPTFFGKMIAFTGLEGENLEERAAEVWDHIEPLKAGPNAHYPLLVVQGGHDPLVADEHGKMFMSMVPTSEKRMEYFSDGIHCIYNHLSDRDMVMGDWLRARLIEAANTRRQA